MKKQLILSTLMVIFGMTTIFAQTTSKNISATLGVATPVLDNGFGLHLGVNPSYSLSDYFGVEAQASVLYAAGDAFLSGDDYNETVGLLVVGGRLYFTKSDKNWRPYLNAMVGGSYSTDMDGFGLGVSTGFYVAQKNGFLAGVAYESTQHFILKVGYTF